VFGACLRQESQNTERRKGHLNEMEERKEETAGRKEYLNLKKGGHERTLGKMVE
jgi:hypothetical protein